MTSSVTNQTHVASEAATPVANKYYAYSSPTAAYKASESVFGGIAKAVVAAVANVFKAIANAAIWVATQFQRKEAAPLETPNTMADKELPDLVVLEALAPVKAAGKNYSKTKVALGTAAVVLTGVGIAHCLGYTQPYEALASGFQSAKNWVHYNGYSFGG